MACKQIKGLQLKHIQEKATMKRATCQECRENNNGKICSGMTTVMQRLRAVCPKRYW